MYLFALQLAAQAHDGQFYGDKPYIYHILQVSHNLTRNYPEVSEDARIAAILHDLVEDTFFELHHLAYLGFSYQTVELVDLVTRKKDHTYKEYIDRLINSGEDEAIKVKLSDIKCHLDNFDNKGLAEKRYIPSKKKLEKALESEELELA